MQNMSDDIFESKGPRENESAEKNSEGGGAKQYLSRRRPTEARKQ